MRKLFAFVLVFTVIALAPVSALAVLDPAVDFPWIATILDFIGAIPGVGPVMQTVVMVIGVVSACFTALAVAFDSICKALSVFSKLAGASALGAKIMAFHDIVSPWLKYLSIYNVQKKVAEPAK